jgi:hypothetical protein
MSSNGAKVNGAHNSRLALFDQPDGFRDSAISSNFDRTTKFDQPDGFRVAELSDAIEFEDRIGLPNNRIVGLSQPTALDASPVRNGETVAVEDVASMVLPDRQQFLFDRLQEMVNKVSADTSVRPGHGLVVTYKIEALTSDERKSEVAGKYLEKHDQTLLDDLPAVEIIKFKVNDDPHDSKHCFFIYQPGVFAGLQVSVADDGQARLADGSINVEVAAKVVDELEQRVGIRLEISNSMHD